MREQILENIEKVIEVGPFHDDWDSLSGFQVPAWYQDGKFGIFIHWGVYSVPAFGNEWYPRKMYQEGTPEFNHHIARYGSQREFGYKDFIPLTSSLSAWRFVFPDKRCFPASRNSLDHL